MTRVAAPRNLMLACGDGNFYLSDLHWVRWGAPTATATGTAHANDCNPYCAAGHFHAYSVVVEASRGRSCYGRRQYTRLSVRYTRRARPGVANPDLIDLGCRTR